MSDIVDRLRARKTVGLNGSAVMVLNVADPDCLEGADEIASLRAKLAKAEEVIAEANNSLFGSQSFFITSKEGRHDKYHLAEAIENLKALSNKRYVKLQMAVEALKPFSDEAKTWPEFVADTERPKTAHSGTPHLVDDAQYTVGDLRRAARALKEIQE